MKSYLKLTSFELSRFFKLYLVLIAITIISQIIGVIVYSNSYLNEMNKVIYEEQMPKAEFLEVYGRSSLFNLTQTLWFLGPIALCIVALIFYVFFIWYRDWFGKNTFIYRLLMLPTARINVFFAKATSIFLMVLGLIALQIVLLFIENMIYQWMVPNEFRTDMVVSQVIQNFHILDIIIPTTITKLILYYAVGFMAVFVIFTGILLERSYRWKGIFLGIGYCAIAAAVFVLPIIIQELLQKNYLYLVELIIIEVILGLFVAACSIWLSSFLLKHRITV
ncbi:hypothetical protein JUJ52_22500 [Virgibacillus sp. AGTR]|uniref:hypothetical protein n=1 Tax=Virgibacillus sp. AGTR TaxID=2812055 RepID=UPI001964C01A|nr:hypothetical protein [Virgibacillus sp. AGTR]MCC2252701.1 hypothetical protein [Virgibacillus sp. AGTR]QRZ19515.1 hypothetical protein JUJ52_07585 [Virgibacillus sp. AGTR]